MLLVSYDRLSDFFSVISNSEQDLRMFKTKTKISGGFRSLKGAESIKRNINPYDIICRIFNNEV